MREEAFRRFFAQRLGARSVDSYLSDLRRVERVLRVDLDDIGADERAVERLRANLCDAQIGDGKIADCLSAFRAYDALKSERVQ